MRRSVKAAWWMLSFFVIAISGSVCSGCLLAKPRKAVKKPRFQFGFLFGRGIEMLFFEAYRSGLPFSLMATKVDAAVAASARSTTRSSSFLSSSCARHAMMSSVVSKFIIKGWYLQFPYLSTGYEIIVLFFENWYFLFDLPLITLVKRS